MMPAAEADAIQLSPADNVATVLRAVTAGESIRVQSALGIEMMLTASQSVPICHKISLATIAPREPVRKYGEVIGLATVDIAPGAHVHVHNMVSGRGRGVPSPSALR